MHKAVMAAGRTLSVHGNRKVGGKKEWTMLVMHCLFFCLQNVSTSIYLIYDIDLVDKKGGLV